MSEDLKEKLKVAQEAIREAREDQIQKKTETDSLQSQYDELVAQTKKEFNLKPEELEDHAAKLEKEAENLLSEVYDILKENTKEESVS